MMRSPRLLFVGNFLIRHWGAGRTGIDLRLAAGALRNNYQVLTFSERDVARFLAPLGVFRSVGAHRMNARLVQTARNWKPDFIFLGHCDYTSNEALDQIKRILPHVRLAHINCDPLVLPHTQTQINRRKDVCDGLFMTGVTDFYHALARPNCVVGYFPNPSDPAYDVLDNSQHTQFSYDLFFAGRPAEADAREKMLNQLKPLLKPTLRTAFFGMGRPLILGRAYEEALATSKMALSLNRFEGLQWYASDRLTHLMANGICTFQYDGNQMQQFFSERETVYFHTCEDLAEKIDFYNTHDAERQKIAAQGRTRYHALFSASRVIRYLVEALAGEGYSENYEWLTQEGR